MCSSLSGTKKDGCKRTHPARRISPAGVPSFVLRQDGYELSVMEFGQRPRDSVAHFPPLVNPVGTVRAAFGRFAARVDEGIASYAPSCGLTLHQRLPLRGAGARSATERCDRSALCGKLLKVATAQTPHQQSWMENSTRQGARTPGQGRQFKNSSIRHASPATSPQGEACELLCTPKGSPVKGSWLAKRD